ncbi:MAG: putative DNA binding domain-containing protein [Acidobacteria bacterium]|jgi:ATP-dependent DNA helicase RecG|nr:putative DNA binding domain-containing protein [Acidobacteriota bacterium]
MPEQQNIEYKQSWHDDYLKWICGFANAQGGTIFIGKDDAGNIVNVPNYKRLMDDLPNKIRDILGIMAEVNLHEENGLYYLEIITPPYAVPISLRGSYYYRSGSTKQELKGNALNEFLLRKSGKTWDDVVEPRAAFADVDEKSIEQFKRDAGKAGRLPDDGDLSLAEFLEKLRLTENGQLKRAAIVLFGKEPGRFFPNQVVKIGRFGASGDDLKFQEIVEGNLLHLLRETAEQLNRKFFTKAIDFEGLQRVETGEYPVAAVREMLLNALVHRDYTGSSVQIRMTDDKFSIWNEGTLPEGLSLESLKRPHPSRPRNPLIADVCFKGGYIDSWGRGTLKIINACREAELPEPKIIEQDGGFLVELFKNRFAEEQLKKSGLNERQIKAVLYVVVNGNIDNSRYQNVCNVSKSTATRDIKELEEKGILVNKGTKGSSAVYELV